VVDLLIFPFVCILEWIYKEWLRFWKVTWWTIKFMAWLLTVPIWDAVVLSFQIIAWVICKLFKCQPPHLKVGKRLMIFSTWK